MYHTGYLCVYQTGYLCLRIPVCIRQDTCVYQTGCLSVSYRIPVTIRHHTCVHHTLYLCVLDRILVCITHDNCVYHTGYLCVLDRYLHVSDRKPVCVSLPVLASSARSWAHFEQTSLFLASTRNLCTLVSTPVLISVCVRSSRSSSVGNKNNSLISTKRLQKVHNRV